MGAVGSCASCVGSLGISAASLSSCGLGVGCASSGAGFGACALGVGISGLESLPCVSSCALDASPAISLSSSVWPCLVWVSCGVGLVLGKVAMVGEVGSLGVVV